jgi:Ca2+-binding RTX toxin-like protein
MTRFVGGPGDTGGTAFPNFADIADLPVLSHSATRVVLDTGFGHYTFKGTGFSGFDSDGIPSHGTITSIVGPDITLSQFSLDFATVWGWIESGNVAAFQAALFSGDDTFVSHNTASDDAATHGEALSGYAGNDTFNMGDSGGGEILSGGSGRDTFNFGAALKATDRVDGGKGNDTLTLNGDYGSGLTFVANTLVHVEKIVLRDGHTYHLTTADKTIAAGASLIVDATRVHGDDSVSFSGEHETNGHITFYGSFGRDTFIGGNGGDLIGGGKGADLITLGTGNDMLQIYGAVDSASNFFDIVTNFDFDHDKIDVTPFAIAGIDPIFTGSVPSGNSYDTNMGIALTAGHLGAHHAVLFQPSSGQSGELFLVIDMDGVAGYTSGADLAIQLDNAQHQDHFSASNFI